MSHIPYAAQAEALIAKASETALQRYPNDPAARYAFELGFLRSEFRSLASTAQLASQPDQIANYLAYRAEIDPDTACELVEGIAAGLKSHFEDDRPAFLGNALDALEEAGEAISAVGDEVHGKTQAAPDECDLARDRWIATDERLGLDRAAKGIAELSVAKVAA